jgi:murein DD-endopeptidase MepM/ murein hydrolase activator NlpD
VTQVKNDNSGGAGRIVEIEHPDGSVTRYLHLVDIVVSQGQQVAQGQKIAMRGGSGWGCDGIQIDGCGYDLHLHFEIYPDGSTPVDPRSVIS